MIAGGFIQLKEFDLEQTSFSLIVEINKET